MRLIWFNRPRQWRVGAWPPQYMDAGPIKGFDLGPLRIWWGDR